MIDAVLFDMDGVLVDSEPVHRRAMDEALAAHGLPYPDEEQWERWFVGRPDKDALKDWFAALAVADPMAPILAEKTRLFTARFPEAGVPYEDARWLARALAAAGLPLALVTGARRGEAELVLETFGLRPLFAATVTGDDVTVGKPDPGPFLQGAAALGVPPARCLVVEDALPGVRAAQGAGCHLVVVDRLGEPERFGDAWTVARLDEAVLARILGQRAHARG